MSVEAHAQQNLACPEKKKHAKIAVIILNRHKMMFTGDIIVSHLCDSKKAVKYEDVKIKCVDAMCQCGRYPQILSANFL